MPPKSKAAVWNRFDLVDGGKKTRCKLCQAKLAYNASTTAMQSHLRAKHGLHSLVRVLTSVPSEIFSALPRERKHMAQPWEQLLLVLPVQDS